MDRKTQLMKIFSVHIRELLTALPMKFDQLQEIRLRAGRPLMLLYDNEERLIGNESGFVTEMSQAYRVSAQEIQETMTFISLIAFSSRSSRVPQPADGFLPDAFFPQFAANKKRPKPTATSANLLILL